MSLVEALIEHVPCREYVQHVPCREALIEHVPCREALLYLNMSLVERL